MSEHRHWPAPRPRDVACMLWAVGWLITAITAAVAFGWTGFWFTLGLGMSATAALAIYCHANGI